VSKIRIRNIGYATEVPLTFRKCVFVPRHGGVMLGSVTEPIVPLSSGSEKFKIKVDLDDAEKIELVFFDTLMYLSVFVVLWIHRKASNIAERYSQVICRTSFQWIPPVIRHSGVFFTAFPYTRLASHTSP
jgi:hypothetical protein